MDKPFKVNDATWEGCTGGIRVTFDLDESSVQDWHNLVNPLDDGGELKRAIELLLERCRYAS